MILSLGASLAGCATVNVPNLETGQAVIEDDERRLVNHDNGFVEMLEHSDLLYQDKGLEDFLNKIAVKLLKNKIDFGDIDIKVKVIQDPSFNAFALSNGYIVINSGIIVVSENEAQLSTLIAHEMTHVLHRHILKKLRSLKNTTAWWDSVGVLTGGLGMIVSELSKVSSVSGFSKELETEADNYGFYLVKEAGYDIHESVKMFQSLNQNITDEQEKEPFFFSSHPNTMARIKNYEKLIHEQESVKPQVNNSAEFYDLIHELVFIDINLALDKGMFKTCEKLIGRYEAIYPKDARLCLLKGDLYKQRQDKDKGVKERFKTDDYPKALAAYKRAQELDPNSVASLSGMGKVLYAMGKKDEAAVYFKQYLELDPTAKDKSFIEQLIK